MSSQEYEDKDVVVDDIENNENSRRKRKKLSTYAVMSFVSGVLCIAAGAAFKIYFAPLAIYLGFKANREQKNNPDSVRTFALDLLGILLGGAVLLIWFGVVYRRFG